MENKKTSYVIFGASGDLAKRYILPALSNMNYGGEIIPISRKDYSNLKNIIQVDKEKIFHLAIPPEGVPDAIKVIYDNFGNDKIKIMLEKPFGEDLESAQNLIKHIEKYFKEAQIYRIDHYLVKKSLEKIATEKWERIGVSGIEIIASEKIDIEGRVNFYEQTGALKDFVQSHLLEMTALVLAGSFKPIQRFTALQNLAIVCDVTKHGCVKRGQYEGYREEVNNPTSFTETFVSINLVSNDPLWRGVAISLATGKALKEKLTQVKIEYKDGVKKVFNIEHEKDAYERVIKAAIEGDHHLFISSNEVLESWRILDTIQQTWKNSNDDLIFYTKGIGLEDVN